MNWLERIIWRPGSPPKQEPLPPVLVAKLWQRHIEHLRYVGYEFPATILDDVMEAGEQARCRGESAYDAMHKYLLGARINVPFKHVCICGHEHP